jgi:hypothetical protein
MGLSPTGRFAAVLRQRHAAIPTKPYRGRIQEILWRKETPASRPKRGALVGRMFFLGIAEALARRGVIELRLQVQKSYRLHNVDRAMHDAVDRLNRLLERQPHRGLRGEIVDVLRIDVLDHADDCAEVVENSRMISDAIINPQASEVGVGRTLLVS